MRDNLHAVDPVSYTAQASIRVLIVSHGLAAAESAVARVSLIKNMSLVPRHSSHTYTHVHTNTFACGFELVTESIRIPSYRDIHVF